MKKTTVKLLVAAMIGTSVTTGLPSMFPSAVYADQTVYTNLSTPVSIENLGTIELKTIFTVPSAEGQVVTFTFEVANTSQQAIDFNRYWFRLQTSDALRYPMRWVDQSKFMIYPGEKKTLFFYTVIPNTVNMSDLNLRLIKWDSSVASFERTLSEIPIHAEVIPTLGRSVSKYIGLTDQTIEARVQMDDVIENDQGIEVNYTFKMVNKGKFAYTIPEYKYILVTSDGVSYPLTANEDQVSQLLPLIEQKVELSGIVSGGVDIHNAALYVLHPYSDNKSQVWLPVTVFRTFEKIEEEETSSSEMIPWGANTELKVKGEDGAESTLSLSVTSIQRFPWDHRDLISAQVKLVNTGNHKAPIPTLTGNFVLGNGYIVQGELISNEDDKDKYLLPGNSITYQLVGYISYVSNFNSAYIELKEDTKQSKVIKNSKIPRISFNQNDVRIPVLQLSNSYAIGEGNLVSTVQFVEAKSYTSTNGNIIVSRVLLKNLEKRGTKVPKLVAYYKTKDGIIYSAKTSPFVEENFPQGSSVISFYAELPSGIKQEDLQLIIGESIAEKGIRNGFSLSLPKTINTVSPRIDEIDYYPYKLKFSNFFAASETGFTFKFSKEKEFNVIANLSDRKLIMEFSNEYREIIGKEEVILEGSNAWDGQVRLQNPSDPRGSRYFTVTLIDEYAGGRIPLAVQSFYIYQSAQAQQ